MADNVVITPGTGNTIAADEVTDGDLGSVKVQYVKLMDGTLDGTDKALVDSSGLKVNLGADNEITGTVTANLSATDNAVLDAIAASVDTLDSVDYATQTTLAAIKAKTDNIPALGQALAAASVPVILPSATITTLTPPAAITGFATSAKQDTIIGHVDGIEGLLTAIDGRVDGVEGLLTTIDADTSVLAGTDFATEAKQDDIITAIEAIPGGGGVQYTEGDTDASITGTAILWEDGSDTLRAVSAAKPLPVSGPLTDTQLRATPVPVSGTVTANLSATDNAVLDAIAADTGTIAGDTTSIDSKIVTVDTDNVTIVDMPPVTVDTTGLATSAKQDTIIGHVDGIEGLLTTIAGDTTDIEAAVELLDDTVQVLGTDTYTEATSKGITLGAVRRDADTTLVNTTNEFTPLQVDANGRLKVEAFSGETLPVSLTSTTVTGTVAVTQSGTWDEVGINDSGNSITVDNGGTFAVQVDGSALTSLQLLDDIVYTDDTSTHSTGSSKGALIMGAATPTDTAVNANDIGAIGMTNNREMYVSLRDISGTAAVTGSGNATGALRVELANNGTGLVGLNAGTNAIGKLAANSGVDIGDVDVTSIAAGTNNIGQVSVAPQTANGLSVFNATSSDGATALTSTAQAIKASAGQVYGWYIYNPNSSAQFVQFYNTAAASVTVGTTNPLFMLTIPATSAANVEFTNGITFSNAGFSCAATATAGGNGAPSTALDAVIFYK